jgi:hypothetical protein
MIPSCGLMFLVRCLSEGDRCTAIFGMERAFNIVSLRYARRLPNGSVQMSHKRIVSQVPEVWILSQWLIADTRGRIVNALSYATNGAESFLGSVCAGHLLGRTP